MTSWLNLMAVAAGGALGSAARYLITLVSAGIPGGSSMLGTTIANVLGCAAIGAFAQYTMNADFPDRLRLAIQVGVLGGLTTFSTFAAESATLAGNDRIPAASFYVAANLVFGWAALVIAAAIVKEMLS